MFNKEVTFVNLQRVLLFDLPSKEDLAIWHIIKILKAPLGLISIYFDPNTPTYTYLMQGFVEVEIVVAPDQSQFIENNI